MTNSIVLSSFSLSFHFKTAQFGGKLKNAETLLPELYIFEQRLIPLEVF